ncbi:3-phosphoshikimate 1-carboxyvinyltransferase [Archaeoglobus sulfaticallidus PM70-1]|uniref:3-phosphoshikimate 1-carboxyvinyltransferase n=1 Tax=Archaeoglobus sulfaticallidus PM70-1 TaxID=387631 RepID=N0BF14_9EURY|nr:3-phosphoshikimate 1-carboxyvinyltransferase [Archaeoglobus sulfaticallidus]AGK60867.1 3-phosphoshikimate 1-carboxyvinyltransferase [Archaeoglobus sulfaticallidus PM70-1]
MDVIIKGGEIDGKAVPPPSKSYTHRAFISASLSRSSRVENPLISLDTLATLKACRFIGAAFERNEGFRFRGVEEIKTSGYLNLMNSGTTIRIFTGLLSLSRSGRFSVLDGDPSLRKRPNLELVLALKKLGARIYGSSSYAPPIWVKGVVKGGEVEISAKSSQFISSLLFTLPLCDQDSEVRVKEVKSRPYIDITLDVLAASGINVEEEGNTYFIDGGQEYRLGKYIIPSDFSSIGYILSAGIAGGSVRIYNAFPSKQGDQVIVDIIREMGGEVRWDKERGIVEAEKSDLEGIEIDAENFPDLVPVLAALSAIAKGKTKIKRISHLRIKEIDRIEGIVRNLGSLGVKTEVVEEDNDLSLIIWGGRDEFHGTVDSFGDHRMALAFSILGLKSRGLMIRNAEVVSVSFPGYFEVMKRLGMNIEVRA